jgi:hypothetical protein
VPSLCELYLGICLTTEEKAWKTLSQGSRRVPVGTMKTEYTKWGGGGLKSPERRYLQITGYAKARLTNTAVGFN